jgi:sulfate/thiosulfate transport system permease protein
VSARARTAPSGAQWAVVGAAAAWVLGLVGLPMIALVGAVAKQPVAVASDLISQGGLDALIRSLVLAALAVLLGGITGTAGGLVLARQQFPGKRLLDALVDLPLAVSPVIVGLAFVVLYGRGGWLAPLAEAAGVQVLFAMPGLVLATAFVCVPFFVREVELVLEEVGTSQEDAARTLGATEWQVFWWVTVPQIRGALRAGTLLTVARALGEFGAVLVLGGAIDGRTQTATTFVHAMLEERHDPAAYGMSLVLAALTVTLVLALPAGARNRH